MDKTQVLVKVSKKLEKLIPKFLIYQTENLAALKDAFAKIDIKKIGEIGHIMKGAGGGYGFNEITNLGSKLELAANDKNIPEIEKNLSDLNFFLKNLKVEFVE